MSYETRELNIGELELAEHELDHVSGGTSDLKNQLKDAVIGLVVGLSVCVPVFGAAVAIGAGAAQNANAMDAANKK